MTAYRAYVHLADNEWGNEIMRQIADEYARQTDKRPLIVTALEHAGWFLSYLYGAPGIRDGAICGTANDGACLSKAVLDFGAGIDNVEIIGDVRR